MSYNVFYQGKLTVSPPLTETHAATLKTILNGECNLLFARIATRQEPTLELPPPAMLTISVDRAALEPEIDSSSPGLDTWLRLIRNSFLAPNGYRLNGEIAWESEEPTDRGIIFVQDNRIEVVEDVIQNPGPSWAPRHHVSPVLRQTIQDLLDSSDESGFSSDFIVVGAPPLRLLSQLLPTH